jgi:hypothetical protein
MVFYMASSGRTVLGEPPPGLAREGNAATREARTEAKPKTNWQENLPEFTMSARSAAIAVVAIVLAVGYYFYSSRVPASLNDRGKDIGNAFAKGDLAQLKASTTPETVDDLVQWYGIANSMFETRKKLWAGQDILVGAVTIEEDLKKRSGEVLLSLVPAKAPERTEALTKAAAAQEMARRSLELTIYFSADPWGKWRVDGRRTLNAAPRQAQ